MKENKRVIKKETRKERERLKAAADAFKGLILMLSVEQNFLENNSLKGGRNFKWLDSFPA